MEESPLVDKKYLLNNSKGKNGGLYSLIPEVKLNPSKPFSWIKVKGKIDRHSFDDLYLMPFANGQMMLAIKPEMQKKIKKSEGDHVHIILYLDEQPFVFPEEFLASLNGDQAAFEFFCSLNSEEQINYVKWIYVSKTDEKRLDRIAKTIVRLSKGKKFADKQ